MAVSIGSISTAKRSSASTSFSYTHLCGQNTGLLILRVSLRGTGSTPSNVSVAVAGGPATLIPNSNAVNTSNRSYNAFFALASPAAGTLNITINWTNNANIISSALDVNGADALNLTAWTTTGNSGSASLAVTCPVNGAVLDCVCANNDRSFTPSNITAHYATIQTVTGNSDVSHRAGVTQVPGARTIGWSIVSSSNYAYSAIALAAAIEEPPRSGSDFFSFF